MIRDALSSLRWLYARRVWAVGFVAAIAMAVHESGDTWWPTGSHWRSVLKLAVYWGLWLAWLGLGALSMRLIINLARQRWGRVLACLLGLVLTSGLIWARFIEPARIQVREAEIPLGCGVRVALVSDLHAGLFVREDRLESLVAALNGLDVDAVLVSGDWTYEPGRDLRGTFAPLTRLRHKLYGVLGNHEERMPGPDLEAPFREAITGLGLELIDGRRVPLGRCELVGLGDLWAGSAAQDLAILENEKPHGGVPASRRIVLAHNPDTIGLYDTRFAALTLSGHTHGGQIDLPVVTERMLRAATKGHFRSGLYQRRRGQVYVTQGIGMSKLPLRFRVPPTIDVLTL